MFLNVSRWGSSLGTLWKTVQLFCKAINFHSHKRHFLCYHVHVIQFGLVYFYFSFYSLIQLKFVNNKYHIVCDLYMKTIVLSSKYLYFVIFLFHEVDVNFTLIGRCRLPESNIFKFLFTSYDVFYMKKQ